MTLGKRLSDASTDGDFAPLPKGVYRGVLNKVTYQEAKDNFSESVNLEFVVSDEGYRGRKLWTTCYTFLPTDGQRDPIWKLAKNLKGLGLKLDEFESVSDAALAIETAALSKDVELEVSVYKKKDGSMKNDAFIKGMATPDDIGY